MKFRMCLGKGELVEEIKDMEYIATFEAENFDDAIKAATQDIKEFTGLIRIEDESKINLYGINSPDAVEFYYIKCGTVQKVDAREKEIYERAFYAYENSKMNQYAKERNYGEEVLSFKCILENEEKLKKYFVDIIDSGVYSQANTLRDLYEAEKKVVLKMRTDDRKSDRYLREKAELYAIRYYLLKLRTGNDIDLDKYTIEINRSSFDDLGPMPEEQEGWIE